MKANKNIRQAYLSIMDSINDKIKKLEATTTNQKNQNIESWILISWLIELQLLKDNKASLEGQLLNDNFDY